MVTRLHIQYFLLFYLPADWLGDWIYAFWKHLLSDFHWISDGSNTSLAISLFSYLQLWSLVFISAYVWNYRDGVWYLREPRLCYNLLYWEASKNCNGEDVRVSVRGNSVLFTVAMWLLREQNKTTLTKTLISRKIIQGTVKGTLAADTSMIHMQFKQKKFFCKILRIIGGFLP